MQRRDGRSLCRASKPPDAGVCPSLDIAWPRPRPEGHLGETGPAPARSAELHCGSMGPNRCRPREFSHAKTQGSPRFAKIFFLRASSRSLHCHPSESCPPAKISGTGVLPQRRERRRDRADFPLSALFASRRFIWTASFGCGWAALRSLWLFHVGVRVQSVRRIRGNSLSAPASFSY